MVIVYREDKNRMTNDFAKMNIIRYIKDCRPKLIWYSAQYVSQRFISAIRSSPPVSAPAVICCYAAAALTTNIDDYVREDGRGLVPSALSFIPPPPNPFDATTLNACLIFPILLIPTRK